MSRSSDALDAPGKPKFRECLPVEGLSTIFGSNPRPPCDVSMPGTQRLHLCYRTLPDFFADIQEWKFRELSPPSRNA